MLIQIDSSVFDYLQNSNIVPCLLPGIVDTQLAVAGLWSHLCKSLYKCNYVACLGIGGVIEIKIPRNENSALHKQLRCSGLGLVLEHLQIAGKESPAFDSPEFTFLCMSEFLPVYVWCMPY